MNSSPESLKRLAERVRDRSFFLGSALAIYQDAEELTEEAMAERLGCSPHTLTLLRLCRMPGHGSHSFERDVNHLAARFEIDGNRLADALREAEFLRAMPESDAGTNSGAGWLMAARDRDATENPQRATDGQKDGTEE
jgi:hypothetical protein